MWICDECGKEIQYVSIHKSRKKMKIDKNGTHLPNTAELVENLFDNYYQCECAIFGLGIELEEVGSFVEET